MGDVTRFWIGRFPNLGIYFPKSGNISPVSELFPAQTFCLGYLKVQFEHFVLKDVQLECNIPTTTVLVSKL